MTTLDNGIVVDEHITAAHITAAADCPGTFGYPRTEVGVTVHHWGADGQNFDDVVNYLASDNPRESSAHFVLQEDRVSCIVSSVDAAWHAGHPLGNASTIGIECRPEMTPGDLATLESLVRWLQGVYGELLVYKHNDWINTQCPGRYADQIDNIVAGINGVNVAPAPVADPASGPAHTCCCHD